MALMFETCLTVTQKTKYVNMRVDLAQEKANFRNGYGQKSNVFKTQIQSPDHKKAHCFPLEKGLFNCKILKHSVLNIIESARFLKLYTVRGKIAVTTLSVFVAPFAGDSISLPQYINTAFLGTFVCWLLMFLVSSRLNLQETQFYTNIFSNLTVY